MSSLKEIAQLNYDVVYPNASAQTSVKVEHFIVEAKLQYAAQMFYRSKEEKRSEGEWEIPSTLWREADVEIKDDKADISSLPIFRSFEGDLWLGNIGGINCECQYIRQTVNTSQILCDEDYWGNGKPYLVVGMSIKFLAGTHKTQLPIIYASNGADLDDEFGVDDTIGALVSEYLYKKFSGKFPADRTSNNNENV